MSDNTLLEDLLEDSQTSYLKKTCPALFDDSGVPNFSYNNILSTDQTLIIPDGLKYYKIVETGNNYVSDLLIEEEKYLKEKYGEELYNYFVNKREDYIDDRMKQVCSNYISVNDNDDSGVSNSLVNALSKQLNSYKQSIVTYNQVNKNKKNEKENGLLDARKFYYRSDALKEANLLDMIISILYFSVLFCCIVYLGFKGRLDFRNKWWIYIIAIIIPLLLSKIYSFSIMTLNEIKERTAEQGPKKAFLNQN